MLFDNRLENSYVLNQYRACDSYKICGESREVMGLIQRILFLIKVPETYTLKVCDWPQSCSPSRRNKTDIWILPALFRCAGEQVAVGCDTTVSMFLLLKYLLIKT
jgi:hypothetical protein